MTAVCALGTCGDPSAPPALRKAFKDDQGTDYEGRTVSGAAAVTIDQILVPFNMTDDKSYPVS